TEKQLKEYGEKLSEGNKKAIEEALNKLKEAHKSQDLATIDSAMEGLNTAWQGAAQEMYASTGGAEGGPQGARPSTGEQKAEGDSDVSDVEYEEVDDKNKK